MSTKAKEMVQQLAKEQREETEAVRIALAAREELRAAQKIQEAANERLVSIARERRADRKSYEFPVDEKAPTKVKVEFGTETKYDVRILEKVKTEIGAKDFEPLFTRKVEYTPTPKLRAFFKAKGGDALKKLISTAQIVKDKKPSVRYLDDKTAEPDAGEE
jgi:hypothetical protein